MTTPVEFPPRVAQVMPEEWDDEVREVMRIFEQGPNNNMVRTFARHPALAQHFLIFNRYLLREASLPPRLRQIAIMRVAWLLRVRYMWSSHLRMSLRVGLTEADFEGAKTGSASTHWVGFEREFMLAVEELVAQHELSETRWNAMAAQLDQRQVMDLLFTVGTYVLLGMVFNTLRVEREPELRQLAERYGAP